MKIEKEYNVQELADKMKESVEASYEQTRFVNLDVTTAQQIVDVLEVVASWENKGTESSDIMERMLKPVCFGSHINGNEECNLCIYERKCMIATEEREKEEAKKKSCFGNYQDCYMCTHCIDYEGCSEETMVEKM